MRYYDSLDRHHCKIARFSSVLDLIFLFSVALVMAIEIISDVTAIVRERLLRLMLGV